MSRVYKQLLFIVICGAMLAPALAYAGTDAAYWHRGKSVSAIADGATEDTITTATGADTSFKDNDRIVVSDGTGYKVEGFVDGTPSATSLAIDDGAGADPGTAEKVGRNLDLNATYYAQAANNTVHDITTEDISVSAWVKVDTDAGITEQAIADKYSTDGYSFYIQSKKLYFYVDDTTGHTFSVYGNTLLDDNKWHYVTGIIDRDNLSNCKVYIDGYVDGTMYYNSTILNVVNITTSQTFNFRQ